MAIATTKSNLITKEMTTLERYSAVFDPIVKPTMRQSWNDSWKNWFCTQDTIEENLTPGKLKCKSFSKTLKIKIVEVNSNEVKESI